VKKPAISVPFESPFAADLRALHAALAAKTVACVFVDDLADVPIFEFLRKGSRLWIVDWLRSRPRKTIASSIVRQDDGGYVCDACGESQDGSSLCANFVVPRGLGARVCASFALSARGPLQCARYEPGLEPKILVADGAMGRAACFAMRVEEVVSHATSPRQALVRALEESRRCSEVETPLDIPSGSIDLAITVQAPNRFGDLSFHYVRELVRRRFGVTDDPDLHSVLPRLRAELFRMQIEGHLRELHRLVDKSRGRVYLGAEPVAATPRANNFALVPGIPLLIELIHRYFVFDFSSVSPGSFLRHASTPDGRARVLQAVVLAPRKRPLKTRDPWAVQLLEGGDS
jgi:hypothetical protein